MFSSNTEWYSAKTTSYPFCNTKRWMLSFVAKLHDLAGIWMFVPSVAMFKHPTIPAAIDTVPKYRALVKGRWIDAQMANRLNVGYFPMVFTVPQELRAHICHNQRKLYNLLFRACCRNIIRACGWINMRRWWKQSQWNLWTTGKETATFVKTTANTICDAQFS